MNEVVSGIAIVISGLSVSLSSIPSAINGAYKLATFCVVAGVAVAAFGGYVMTW